MNKVNLIGKPKHAYDLTKAEATAVIETFFGEMSSALARGKGIENPWTVLNVRKEITCLTLVVIPKQVNE